MHFSRWPWPSQVQPNVSSLASLALQASITVPGVWRDVYWWHVCLSCWVVSELGCKKKEVLVNKGSRKRSMWAKIVFFPSLNLGAQHRALRGVGAWCLCWKENKHARRRDSAIWTDNWTKYLKSELLWKAQEAWVSVIMLLSFLFKPTNSTCCSGALGPWLLALSSLTIMPIVMASILLNRLQGQKPLYTHNLPQSSCQWTVHGSLCPFYRNQELDSSPTAQLFTAAELWGYLVY